jgi:hypothetical protein
MRLIPWTRHRGSEQFYIFRLTRGCLLDFQPFMNVLVHFRPIKEYILGLHRINKKGHIFKTLTQKWSIWEILYQNRYHLPNFGPSEGHLFWIELFRRPPLKLLLWVLRIYSDVQRTVGGSEANTLNRRPFTGRSLEAVVIFLFGLDSLFTSDSRVL